LDVDKLLKSLKTYCEKKDFTELTKTHRRYLSRIAVGMSIKNFKEDEKKSIVDTMSKTLKLSDDIIISKMGKCLKDYSKGVFYNKVRALNQQTLDIINAKKSSPNELKTEIENRAPIYMAMIESYVCVPVEYNNDQGRENIKGPKGNSKGEVRRSN
jgi:3-methyladenine DNA glycosylase AlkD